MEFLPPRHPVNRIGKALRSDMVCAQRSIIGRVFGNAGDFCERVLDDLKVDVAIPGQLGDEPVQTIADMEFADLQEFFARILVAAGTPGSAVGLHSTNLARHAQLLRAFDNPEAVLDWATAKVIAIIADLPKTAGDIECGRNPGDVLDPYLLAATQSLLCEGDFRSAIGATVSHKALMILEGLMGHLHEEVIGRMRGNVRNPEPRADNAEILDFQLNPFPGADVVQPPVAEGEPLRLHQIKSKTGTLNSSGGRRLAVRFP